MRKNNIGKKLIAVAIFLAIALLSIFVFSKVMTNPQTYSATIQSIDDKKATVMGLTATAAATSTALAAVPGDVTTPIATQILDLSACLLIVVCVLVLEKSLLTVMGYLSFNILIPIACALLSIYVFVKKDSLKTIALKFIVFALVIVSVIPLSLKISDLIYEANKATVEQVTAQIDEDITMEENNEEDIAEEDEEKSVLGNIWQSITQITETVTETVTNTTSAISERANEILNNFIDAIALFIIVYCAIPVIVVLVVIGFVKFLFGISIPSANVENFLPSHRKKNNESHTADTHSSELLEV